MCWCCAGGESCVLVLCWGESSLLVLCRGESFVLVLSSVGGCMWWARVGKGQCGEL